MNTIDTIRVAGCRWAGLIARRTIFFAVTALLATQIGLPAVAQDPSTVFVSEESQLLPPVARDGTVFWGAYSCEGEIFAPTPFVRSKLASDGPIHTLFNPPICDNRALSNASTLAVDDAFVYWADSNARIVRLRRAATPPEIPTVVSVVQNVGLIVMSLAVDEANLYWLETNLAAIDKNWTATGGYIVRMPKNGGPPIIQKLTDKFRSGSLRVDTLGAAYYLGAGTLMRLAPSGSSFSGLPIGNAGHVQAYTLDNNRVYWIEKANAGADLLVRSATFNYLSQIVTHYTIPGGTAPTVWEMAVDGTNLYWIDTRPDRSDHSPYSPRVFSSIVRLPLNGDPPVTLTGYTSQGWPWGLITTGEYLFWLDGWGIRRLPTNAAGLDLTAQEQGLEVVQVIQGPHNDVPLIADKTTYVRFYARIVPGSTSQTEITVSPTAVLTGTREGQPLPGSPLVPIRDSAMVNATAVDRRTSETSLFRLPNSWVNGTIALQATLNPAHAIPEGNYANNTSTATVTFQAMPHYCLQMVPIQTVDGTLTGPTVSLTLFVDHAASAWPVARFDVRYRGGPGLRRPRLPFGILQGSDPWVLDTDFEMGYLLWNMWWAYVFNTGGICNGGGTIVGPVSNAGRYGMRGMGVVFFTTQGGGLKGLAHEVAHDLGRSHVGCPNSGPGAPSSPDGGYPYPVCQLDDDGELAHVGLDPLALTLLPPATTSDYMSYSSRTLWTSDYTYGELFNALRAVVGFTALSATMSPNAGNAARGKLFISGLLEPAPLIGFAFPVSSEHAGAVTAMLNSRTEQSQNYQLRTYDRNSELIASVPLRVAHIQSEGGAPGVLFFNLVDTDREPERYEVVTMSGTTLLTRTAGARAPVVRILSPTAGGSFDSFVKISWRASDPDGDPLLFAVRYSADNGQTWQMLGNLTSERSLQLDLAGLPGGTQSLIQVMASDGVHTANATAGPFSVARHPPRVAILDSGYHELSPQFPTAVDQSQELDLRAQAYDVEDGSLKEPALKWNLRGPVTRTGTGALWRLGDLPPGPYAVTLAATDSDGQTREAHAAVTVSPKRIFDGFGSPKLDGYCWDSVYAMDRDLIRLRYATGETSEVRVLRVGNALYACFAGLPLVQSSTSFAGLRFAFGGMADEHVGVGDLGFFVNNEGIPSTAHGDPAGNWIVDPAPQGLVASVSHSDLSWSAEFRIDVARLGGWTKLVRMRADHYQRIPSGQDATWPAGSLDRVPSSWGLTAFGRITQIITFPQLPDRRVTDPGFGLTATASSGLQITYTASGKCIVSDERVTLTGPGICKLTAFQQGNNVFEPANPVTRSFAIHKNCFIRRLFHRLERLLSENLIETFTSFLSLV
jgi:hypothetical protein